MSESGALAFERRHHAREKGQSGRVVGHVNGTHCLVIAEKA